MTATLNLHRAIAVTMNAIMVSLIIYFVIRTGSDKSPIIFMVFYLALTILNVLIAIFLGLFKRKQATIYKQIVIGQLLLFIPLALVIAQL